MRCTSCTTELWGNPRVCPVCGTPTRAGRASRKAPLSPRRTAPQAPAPQQSSGFFNASDLLDPGALDSGVSSSLNTADLVDPVALDGGRASQPPGTLNAADLFEPPVLSGGQASQPPGTLNAADLFEPAVLADLSLPGEGGIGAQEPAYGGFAAKEEGEIAGQDKGTYRAQATSRPLDEPVAPLFTLTPLASPPPAPLPRHSAPLPSVPPPPARDPERSSGPLRVPDEMEQLPERSWRIAPSAQPARRRSPVTEPPFDPLGMPYAAAPVPSQFRSTWGHWLLRTAGGILSLILVLAIIGVATLFAAMHYYQIQALQASLAQPTTPASLPTVAPKPGYTIYTDHALAFSLQYPGRWHESADQDGSDAQYKGDLFSADPYAALEVGSSPQYQGWSPAQMNAYILSNIFTPDNVANVQTSVPASPTVHFAALDWTAEEAAITLANGASLHMTSLAITHNGRGYVVFYFASSAVFSNYDSQYFEPMLFSFRFMSS